MKHAILFLLLAVAILPLSADLFFSEYIEGSSSNKALEIYNPGAVGVDLTNYSIRLCSNGGGTWDAPTYNIDIQGTIAPGDVWVICNSAAVAEIQAVSDSIGSSATYYNGDDAVGLVYDDGTLTLLDVIGVQGEDPGSYWPVAGVADGTKEHTLVRKLSVTTGNAGEWPASAGTNADDSEWIVYDQNTFTFLGSHGGGNVAPNISNVYVNPQFPEPTDTVIITAEVTDLARSVASVDLDWGTDGSTYPNNINMSLTTGSTYETDSAIPAQVDGTTVYFRVTATDDEGDSNEYFNSYTVSAGTSVTIYDIQGQTDDSPYLGQTVTTYGICTGATSSVFWLQDGAGAWNGMYCYEGGHSVSIGDSVEVTGAIQEYYNLTEINVSAYTVINSGNTLPAASVITTGEAASEAYESVLVQVVEAPCTAGISSGLWTVDDGTGPVRVADMMYEPATVTVGANYTVTGPTYYSYNEFRIAPRDANDVIESVDQSAPVVTNVTVQDANTVAVQFNEELDQDSAEETFNYYISARVSISNAALDGADPSLVILTVSDFTPGNYTLEVNDVEDLAGNGCDGETYDFIYTAGPLTISDIQGTGDTSPYVGETVTLTGICTGAASSYFWIQDATGAWNGMYCYEGGHTAIVGDEVEVTGVVAEYNGLTEINVDSYTINSSGNTLPAASVVTTAEAASEAYESVLVQVVDATCTAGFDSNNLWTVDDGSGAVRVASVMYAPATLSVGSTYTVTGPTYYSWSEFRIAPRDAADVIMTGDTVPPAISSVSADDAYTVVVEFTEAVEETSAETVGNYAIVASVRVSVSAAELSDTDPTIVTLTVDGLDEGDYDLTVNGVQDLSGNACVNISESFTYTAPQPTPVIVITEIMQNPSAVYDSDGEYFEIYNNDTVAFDMNGWIIRDNDSDSHTLSAGGDTLLIQPGEYYVFGINGDYATNGGVNVNYQYADFTLSNGADEVVVVFTDGTVIDEADYDGGSVWPDPNGASMMFMGGWADNNNDGTLWEAATTAWTGSAGDFGTPGASNAGALDAPADLIITMNGASAILTWTDVPGATTYHVYRSVDGVSFTLLGDTPSATYTDTDAGLESRYYYHVTAE